MVEAGYRQFCQARQATGLWRSLDHPVAERDAGRVRLDARWYLDFTANDYLGLAHHPELIRRACAWTQQWGAGTGASRLISGDLEPFQRIEHRLAAAKGQEAALVFNSGFQANSAILASLLDQRVLGATPLVFSDRLNHASIHQGCQTAGVRQIRYRHNDLNHLESLLQRHDNTPGPRFILTETLFSMDGDQVDIPGLLALKQRYRAFLYLDEAHATGVLGENGFGLACAATPEQRADLVMGTFSKALGGFGAYAACSTLLRNYLINHCAGLIYATALPPAVLGAMEAALDLLPTLTTSRQRLLANAARLRASWRETGLNLGNSTSWIIPWIIGQPDRALALSRDLAEAGLLAMAIRPPTVPAGSSRLRFCLSAAHTEGAIDHLDAMVRRLAMASLGECG